MDHSPAYLDKENEEVEGYGKALETLECLCYFPIKLLVLLVKSSHFVYSKIKND